MVWPFSSSSRSETAAKDETQKGPVSWQGLLKTGDDSRLAAAREWAPVVGISIASLGILQLYANYLRRIPGAAYVKPNFFHRRSLFGKVTSVGDGDGFRLFHTPGGKAVGWGWLRKVPTSRKELKDRTVSIRIAGVDAPECAHFGRPAQPFADEAMKWLSNYVLHRNVRVYVYRRDMYERIVASVYVRRYFIRRDVGLELIKRGLATVYEGKSAAEFGGLEDVYIKAEAKAKRQRKGMWSIKADVFESPRAYKTRWAAVKDTVTETVKDTVKGTGTA